MGTIYSNSQKRKDYLLDRLKEFDSSNNLLICSPYYTNNDYMKHIIVNKINLRLVLRLCVSTNYKELERLLKVPNIEVRFFSTREFHSKIYVIDNEAVIIGSSNFTKSGITKNMELNIVLDNNFPEFQELVHIALSYWNEAEVLTSEVIEELKSILKGIDSSKKKDDEELEDKIAGIKSKAKKKREFSELHKKRISESNKGRQGAKLEGERLKKLNEAAIAALSIPVVCINTEKKYDSMQIAALEVYGYDRGYGYIGDVCKGKKEHYKKLLWRYYDDYISYSDSELQELQNLIFKIETKNYTEHSKTKILYHDKKFDSLKEFGDYAFSIGLINESNSRVEQIISAHINSSVKRDIPFVRLNYEGRYDYFYFADYDIVRDKEMIIEETPVRNSLEEYFDEYNELYDLIIGDMTLGDLLYSDAKVFYKFDGIYFKSKVRLKNEYAYDEIIDKNTLIELIDNSEYSTNWKFDINQIKSSNKNKYYVKNGIIFKKRNEYVDDNVIIMTRNDILIELGLSL